MKNNKFKEPKIVKFHFYKGKSLLSRIIKWRTNGIYSHVSIEIEGVVYESWVGHGACSVIKSTSPYYYHTPKTEIDTIEIPMQNWRPWKTFLDQQIGKGYDFLAILSFIRNKTKQNENKWFCSELGFTFLNFEIILSNRFFGMISPQTLFYILKSYKMGLEKKLDK